MEFLGFDRRELKLRLAAVLAATPGEGAPPLLELIDAHPGDRGGHQTVDLLRAGLDPARSLKRLIAAAPDGGDIDVAALSALIEALIADRPGDRPNPGAPTTAP